MRQVPLFLHLFSLASLFVTLHLPCGVTIALPRVVVNPVQNQHHSKGGLALVRDGGSPAYHQTCGKL